MRKAWVGFALGSVLEYAASVFFGSETVKGWLAGNPSEWLASFAGWPLYSAFSVLAVGLFIIGSIHLAIVFREGLNRLLYRRVSRQNAERDAIVETMERMVNLYRQESRRGPRMDPMQRLSLLEIGRFGLAPFDLAAPDGVDDTKTVMFYQRLLPYLRISVSRAQEMARSWKRQLDDPDRAA